MIPYLQNAGLNVTAVQNPLTSLTEAAAATEYKLLADNPHMGPARPDIAKELRYHPVGNYLLLYRVIANGIELVRVVHGARDLQQLF